MDFIDFLKPYFARVIGTAVGAFFAWLTAKNINVDADTQQQAVAAVTGVGLAVFGVLYAIVHKVVDKHVNPSDAAAKANILHGEVVKDKASV